MKKNLRLTILFLLGLTAVKAQVSANEGRALDFIKSQSNKVGSRTNDHFKLKFVSKGAAGEILRFQQTINDVPVYETEFLVNFDNDNEIVFSTNNLDYTVENIATLPQINSEQAKLIAIKELNPTGEITFQKSELLVYNKDKGTRLVYRTSTLIDDKPGDWEVFIDAITSEVISVKNVAMYHHLSADEKISKRNKKKEQKNNQAPFFKAPLAFVSGTALVFDPDPLSSAHVAYGGNYIDNADATNAQLDAARIAVTLPEIDLTAGVYRLKSSYVDIADFEKPKKGLFTQATSVFNYNRFDDNFEAVNAFYYLDKSMRYINSTLGVYCRPSQNGGVFQFDPSGLSGIDNSHYIPASENIAFGEGCVDDAEDADVVLHEFGHAIHDWLTGGNSSQVNGLGEGSGDYWAQSYSRSLNQWATTEPAYNYVFSWDGNNDCWSGRTTNYGPTYTATPTTTEIHDYGQVWATVLMKIYNQIGRQKTDKAFLEGLKLTGSTTNQPQAATAVRQAAINMNYSCADIKTMTTLFNETGYKLPAVTFTLNVPANLTASVAAGNVYVLPNYASQCNAISANCDSVISQSPVSGTSLSPGVHTITMLANSPTGKSVNALVSKTFTLTVQSVLGVNEVLKNNLKVYPNPSATNITIKGDFIANQNIAIFNVLGQKVMENTLKSDESVLDISKLALGVYTIKFKETKATIKFVRN